MYQKEKSIDLFYKENSLLIACMRREKMYKEAKTQAIFYTQSIAGMLISHFIPTFYFWFWIILSLVIGHFINKWNYKKSDK
jgi:hypothetical protein